MAKCAQLIVVLLLFLQSRAFMKMNTSKIIQVKDMIVIQCMITLMIKTLVRYKHTRSFCIVTNIFKPIIGLGSHMTTGSKIHSRLKDYWISQQVNRSDI